MDGGRAWGLYPIVRALPSAYFCDAPTTTQIATVIFEVYCANVDEAAAGPDLVGCCKYFNENFCD